MTLNEQQRYGLMSESRSRGCVLDNRLAYLVGKDRCQGNNFFEILRCKVIFFYLLHFVKEYNASREIESIL